MLEKSSQLPWCTVVKSEQLAQRVVTDQVDPAIPKGAENTKITSRHQSHDNPVGARQQIKGKEIEFKQDCKALAKRAHVDGETRRPV